MQSSFPSSCSTQNLVPLTTVDASHQRTTEHYDVYGQLTTAWLENVAAQHCLAKKQNTPSSASLLKHEKELMEEIVGPSVKLQTPEFNEMKIKVYGYCKKLLQDTKHQILEQVYRNSSHDEPMQSGRETVAKLLYLAERNMAVAAICIKDQSRNTRRAINKAFDAEISKTKKQLDSLENQYAAWPLQNPKLAVCVQKPLLIAQMLITSCNKLNLGLIEPIIEELFDKAALSEEEKEQIQTLQNLLHSKILQDKLMKITKPDTKNELSNDLIRIALNLPPTAIISEIDTKTVALAALLSHMRQGDVGSCFGTVVTVMMMGTLKSKVLTDFTNMLLNGQILRSSKSTQKEFIPILDIGDSTLEGTLEITQKGESVRHPGQVLWNLPGLIAAGRQLGIRNLEAELRKIAKEFFDTKIKPGEKSVEITPEYIIKKLASLNSSLTHEERRDLKNKALFAFSAQTANPILKGWESCIASMAEAFSTGDVREHILSTITKTLKPYLPPSQYAITTYIFGENPTKNAFAHTLNSGMQIRYNERVKVEAHEVGDGHSKAVGAFVLHHLKHGEQSVSAKEVKTPEEFTKFVLSILKTTVRNLGKNADLKSLSKARAYMAGPEDAPGSFINQSILNYNLNNNSLKKFDDIKDLYSIWKKLPHLPFRDAKGGNPVPVLQEAVGIDNVKPEKVTPKNAKELLESFITFARKHQRSDKGPLNRYMVENGIHAFSLISNHPTAIPALAADLEPDIWVSNNVLTPCQKLAAEAMTVEMKDKYVQALTMQYVPKELADTFRLNADKLYKPEASITSYSKALTSLLIKTMNIQENNALYQRTMASILVKSVLSDEQRKLLLEHSVVIADTNWIDTEIDEDIYFRCVYNLISEEIELCSIDENDEELRYLDQAEWVKYVPWTMFGIEVTSDLDADMVLIEK